MGVGERRAGRLELLEEAPGDGHVEAAQVGSERLDSGRRGARRRRPHGRQLRVWRAGTERFIRMNRGLGAMVRLPLRPVRERERGDRDAQRGHDLPVRRGLVRLERGRDRLRLALRELEEPGQDVAEVLGRHDLRELDDAGQTEPAIAQRPDHLGEPLDELRGGLPVERGGRARRRALRCSRLNRLARSGDF